MPDKYIVVDYDSGKSKEPNLAADHLSQSTAIDEFEKMKTKNSGRAVVLFNTLSAEVVRIAILGEPIYLAKALTFARTFVKDKSSIERIAEGGAKGAAGYVISKIAEALAGETLPGVGGAVVGHFVAPYYAFKGDDVNAAKAASGIFGGLSGGIIGTILAGPLGAFIGGVIGGLGLSEGTGAIVKALTEHPKCEMCSGAGLIGYYEICPECNGYGYRI